ncbi:piggyBac transposable element-derived protein 4-like isoform X2 [Diabrotica virgifera virgifera]|uniref:PiggyBac transposable element-derived protein domain-containing protein n=1 Tax=Diabrotica virgifera virgifera TaxID=50390 RepID=A0ABM5L8F4_DIAVI|nr:piggyBac transposable element-derived protein 4-like isoform X2 [Diabrotica virgifera virgifera]
MECSGNLKDADTINQLLPASRTEEDYLNECVKMKVKPELEECKFESNNMEVPILNQSLVEDIKLESQILKHETIDPVYLSSTMQDIKVEIKEETEELDVPIDHNDEKKIMENEPGPPKKVKCDSEKHHKLTEAELLAALDESDEEIDPFYDPSDPLYDSDSDIESEEDSTVSSDMGNIAPNDWSFTEIPNQSLPFTKTAGFLVDVNSAEPFDYFQLLATDDFFNMLCEKANKYPIDVIAQDSGSKSRITSWYDVNVTEMKIFLGLLFHMGSIRMDRMNDYWEINNLVWFPSFISWFPSFMSCNRFLLIFRSLQFEDTGLELRDFGKIMPLINYYNNRMMQIYYPNRELCINESMSLWKGRVKFPYYIKKRLQFGLKLYILCEASGTVLKLLLVDARCEDPSLSDEKHAEQVVLNLLEEQLDNGHSVFIDNLYSSLKLAEELLLRKTYVTGILRCKTRKGKPEAVVKTKLKKGGLVVQYNSQGICIIKWRDFGQVTAISSEFNASMNTVVSKRGREKKTPVMLDKHDEFTAGVDYCDQVMSYYPCENDLVVWYKKVAIHIFQIMMLTSYYLYKKGNPNSKMIFYDYRLHIIKKLIGLTPPEPL